MKILDKILKFVKEIEKRQLLFKASKSYKVLCAMDRNLEKIAKNFDETEGSKVIGTIIIPIEKKKK